MREDFAKRNDPLQVRNFWTKGLRDHAWIEACLGRKSQTPKLNMVKKAPDTLWRCYSKNQQARPEPPCYLAKKISKTAMSTTGEGYRITSTSSIRDLNSSSLQPTFSWCSTKDSHSPRSHSLTSHSLTNHSLTNHSLTNQSLTNHSLRSQSMRSQSLKNQSLKNQSLKKQSLKSLSLRNSVTFSCLRPLPVKRLRCVPDHHLGNVNSNNKPSNYYNTSDVESSEEEFRAPDHKKTPPVFKRKSSAIVNKPQLKKEPFVVSNVTSHVDASNNAEKDSDEDSVASSPKSKTDKSFEGKKSFKGNQSVASKKATGNKQTAARSENSEYNHEAIDSYVQTLVGGDAARPVELKHYNSNEFIGQMLKMRGGWRFNISFSELEGEGDMDQIEEGNREEDGKVSKEEKPEPAEFCGGKFRSTFDEFIGRWKNSESHNVFQDLDSDDANSGFDVTCHPKARKVKFSRFKTNPKRFGECEINLFYAPRKCQL